METWRSNLFKILVSAGVCVKQAQAIPPPRTDYAWTLGLDLTSSSGFLVLYHSATWWCCWWWYMWIEIPHSLGRGPEVQSLVVGIQCLLNGFGFRWFHFLPSSLCVCCSPLPSPCCSSALCGCSGVLSHCPPRRNRPSQRSHLRLYRWHGGAQWFSDCPQSSFLLWLFWTLLMRPWVCRLRCLPKPRFQAASDFFTCSVFPVFMSLCWESWFCSMV